MFPPVNQSTRDEIHSLHDEIDSVKHILENLQHRLSQFGTRLDEEEASWRTQVDELQRENSALSASVRNLRRQNDDPGLSTGKPRKNEPNVFRLRRAQKVIRDLIDERMESDETLRQTGKRQWRFTDENIQKMLDEALGKAAPDGVVSASTASMTTGMNSGKLKVSKHGGRQMDRPLRLPPIATQSVLPIGPGAAEGEPSDPTSGHAGSKPFAAAASSIVSPDAAVATMTSTAAPLKVHTHDDDPWRIHFSKPGTAPYVLPMQHDEVLHKVKKLQIEDQINLEDLQSSSNACVRLQIADNYIFVYDPMFLDSAAGTFLIDWGTQELHSLIEQYLDDSPGGELLLHTFAYFSKKKLWGYIGAMTWKTVTTSWEVWPTLARRSKQSIIRKLANRSQDTLTEQAVEQCLDSGEFSQMCIQLSGAMHRDESNELVHRLGYRQPAADVEIDG